ncbi:MAG: translocase [Bryobacterales bacterium]|nr:translocase [Bryobacterales bacterium]
MSAASQTLPAPPRSMLDRLLSPFSRVENGEGAGALLLAANVFLLLGSYYVLKTVREALILSEAGAEVKSYASAGQAALMLLLVPLYSWFGSRVGRLTLVAGSTLFFAAHLAVFFLLGQTGVHIGVAFFLWLGVYNMFVVAQFWAFANDLYTEEQGKRLFPIIGVGASLGAWLGSLAAKELFKTFTPHQLMLLTIVILAACAGLTYASHLRQQRRSGSAQARAAEEPLNKSGGFQLVLSDRYLRLIATLVLLLNLVNTTGEFLMGDFVADQAVLRFGAGEAAAAQRGAFIGQFYGDFFGWVNLSGFLIQTFLVSRVFKYAGVGAALFVLPVIALGGYGFLIFAPVLGIVRVAKILENSTDYSLNNTVRHALFLNTSREAKYKAKAAIDTFFVRFGDMVQAAVVYAGTAMAWTTKNFAVLNACFVVVWLLVAVQIHREFKRQEQEANPVR